MYCSGMSCGITDSCATSTVAALVAVVEVVGVVPAVAFTAGAAGASESEPTCPGAEKWTVLNLPGPGREFLRRWQLQTGTAASASVSMHAVWLIGGNDDEDDEETGRRGEEDKSKEMAACVGGLSGRRRKRWEGGMRKGVINDSTDSTTGR